MVDHLDQTEIVDRELNVVKRARFNPTIETYKTTEVPKPKFGVRLKSYLRYLLGNLDRITCY